VRPESPIKTFVSLEERLFNTECDFICHGVFIADVTSKDQVPSLVIFSHEVICTGCDINVVEIGVKFCCCSRKRIDVDSENIFCTSFFGRNALEVTATCKMGEYSLL